MKLLYRKRDVGGNNEKMLSIWCVSKSWALPITIAFTNLSYWRIQFLCFTIEYVEQTMPYSRPS